MNLLIEYFTSPHTQRDLEYKTCISENIKNELISKIFVFISDDSNLDIQSEKLVFLKREERPTFYDLLDFCNLQSNDEIYIIANSDIFFDNTLLHINKFNMDNIFLALTRWDVLSENGQWSSRFFNHTASQDVWIFKTPIQVDKRSKFYLGKPGCDNRIAQLYHEMKYDVRNPSLQIKSYHYHITSYRTYNQKDIIHGPYLLLQPTNDISVETPKKTISNF